MTQGTHQLSQLTLELPRLLKSFKPADTVFGAVVSSAQLQAPDQGNIQMSTINQSMQELMTCDGAMCAALVDSASGMILGQIGSGVDLEVAAAGNTEVVRAKLKTMRALGLSDVIEDILITLGKQYHIIRPMARKEGLFIYIVLDKTKSNLALARRKVLEVEKELSV